ncbi:MAG TPA: hypothetical protein VH590_07315 [Ktedonobacterales bacterium]
MGAPAPVSPAAPRRVAFRQGLLFGSVLGVAALLVNICGVFFPLSRLSFSTFASSSMFSWLTYLLAGIVFFFAGWRAAQHTGRMDMGALAGFWAGVVGAIVGVIIDIVLLGYVLSSEGPSISRTSLLDFGIALAFLAVRDAVLALLFGAGLGALGGFIGRTYASGQAAPAQPNQGPAVPSPAPQAPAPPQSQP